MSSSKAFALPARPQSLAEQAAESKTKVISGGIRLGGPITLPPAPVALPSSEASSSSSQVTPGGPGGSSPMVIRALTSEPKLALGHDTASSQTALGKRKAPSGTPPRDFTLQPGSTARTDRAASTFSTFSTDTKPLLPIALLPLPLPSKRFKKSASSKAVLIPVEQLPVYPLPPPPPIRDASLAKQVFIHSSCFPKTRSRFEDAAERPTEHYEKLEHVGDSILGMVVTTWLHEVKPGLSCGTASVSQLSDADGAGAKLAGAKLTRAET